MISSDVSLREILVKIENWEDKITSKIILLFSYKTEKMKTYLEFPRCHYIVHVLNYFHPLPTNTQNPLLSNMLDKFLKHILYMM